jgi:hypothetical protein
MEKGCGEWEYFDEKELDSLEKNWNIVKTTLQGKQKDSLQYVQKAKE